ncbi:MAG: AraC family transcriptional regulator [Desulfobacteraceae bacterium]|nr:AraC family transcriptional regulator [Desulfobacteraceae bacterium]
MRISKTTSAVAIIALFDLIRDYGIPIDTLEKETGINRRKMDDPDARITMTRFLKLWQIAEKVSKDPAIGLNLRQKYGTGTMHFVVTLAMNSPNLLKALEAWMRYDMLICDNYRNDIFEGKDHYRITYTNISPEHENRWIPEHHMFLALEYGRRISQTNFNPVQIFFRHADPGYGDIYKKCFNCPVFFNRKENMALFKKQDLKMPILGQDPYLHAILKKHAEKSIKKLSKSLSFKDKVQEFIIKNLPRGIVDLQSASNAMNMDRSTLHRHLKKESIGFKQLLTQTRKELAKKYLTQGMSITQTSYLLGFADPSTFQRAFKHWTQISPGKFREQKIMEEPDPLK